MSAAAQKRGGAGKGAIAQGSAAGVRVSCRAKSPRKYVEPGPSVSRCRIRQIGADQVIQSSIGRRHVSNRLGRSVADRPVVPSFPPISMISICREQVIHCRQRRSHLLCWALPFRSLAVAHCLTGPKNYETTPFRMLGAEMGFCISLEINKLYDHRELSRRALGSTSEASPGTKR